MHVESKYNCFFIYNIYWEHPKVCVNLQTDVR